MNEQQTVVFSLPANLYAPGAPVVIAEGSLCKDSVSGRASIRLKFCNIQPKTVTAVKVRIRLLDAFTHPLGEETEQDFLDLWAERDSVFGEDVVIPVEEEKARAFRLSVEEVAFADLTLWQAGAEVWEPLKEPVLLVKKLNDWELAKQYAQEVGGNSTYWPEEMQDLWRCACGGLNRQGENCHLCDRAFFEFQMISLGQLEVGRNNRLVQQKAREKAGKTKKRIAILLCALVATATAVFSGVTLMPRMLEQNKYDRACALMESGEYARAIELFAELGVYQDCPERIAACETAMEEQRRQEQYDAAVQLMENGEYAAAAAVFEDLPGYRDSDERRELAILEDRYQQAQALEAEGKYPQAGIAYAKLGDFRDSRERSFAAWHTSIRRNTVVVGNAYPYEHYVLAIRTDGTVMATGANGLGQLNVHGWDNLVEIHSEYTITYGLRADGTVLTTGRYRYVPNSHDEVTSWTDIVTLVPVAWMVIGMKRDGTLVVSNDFLEFAEGLQGWPEILGWTDIVRLSQEGEHIVGLRMDGTVVAVGENKYGECDVEDWTDIVEIRTEQYNTIGIKADGSVVATGKRYSNVTPETSRKVVDLCENVMVLDDGTVNVYNMNDSDMLYLFDNRFQTGTQQWQMLFENWRNVKQVYYRMGRDTVMYYALTDDGRVLAAGVAYNGSENVSDWTNIVDIYTTWWATIGLRADGTLVIADNITSEAETWTNIRLPG